MPSDHLWVNHCRYERQRIWRERWQWAKLWIIFPSASVALVVVGYCLGRL